jgi:response regulator RpfG family c-di-GMP phosphodiesterase
VVNNHKVLIVDSNPKNAALIEGYIKPYYDVLRADSGEKCLELIKEKHISLVVMAVVLPGLNGYETCKKLKDNAQTKHIPVVMIPALPSAQEKMRSLQSGADDFIDKPFTMNEVLARVKSVLKMKDIQDELVRSDESLNALISCTSGIYRNFSSSKFDEKEFYNNMVNMLLKKHHSEKEKPAYIFVGGVSKDEFSGVMHGAGGEPFNCTMPSEFYKDKHNIDGGTGLIYSNKPDSISSLLCHGHLHPELAKALGNINNFAGYISNHTVVVAFNYGHPVSLCDAQIIKGLAIHAPFLKSISNKRQDMEDAFAYTVNALSRAGEANVEDTGKHVLRMNKYAVIIAQTLGLPEKFIRNIGIAAQLHDVGNIYIHCDILKKPKKLLPDELDNVKQHTLYGARLLGEHPKLKMAQNVALAHHENWDGSGYPYGLKEGMIPMEARIVGIADKYDVLRSGRVYKSPFSHVEACMIIAEGDGRSAPSHFDPNVHRAFKSVSRRLEDVFEELQ